MELISVVVPVYNVCAYLDNCIKSVLNQTYTNIEIILVDDGSKDSSGNICDSYGKAYSNVRVIHKDNGGLSDARNVGIRASHGEYIVFVDGDDLIESRMVEYLYKLIKKYDAEIGICELLHCYDGANYEFEPSTQEKVYSSESAIIEMLYQSSFLVSACGKIYPTKFFGDIEFPIGMLFEDSAIMHRIFEKANKIVYGNAKLYGYMHRENSITTSRFSKRDCDILIICEQLSDYFRHKKPMLLKAVNAYYTNACLRIFLNAPRTGEFNHYIDMCKKIINKNAVSCIFDPRVRTKLRIALLLFKLSKQVLFYVYKRIDRWS